MNCIPIQRASFLQFLHKSNLPQDCLTTSSGCKTTFEVLRNGLESRFKRSSAADIPNSYPGCRTAVKGGFSAFDQGISSKPIRAISLGILIPCAFNSSRQPRVIKLLVEKIAVNRSLSAKSSFVLLTPPFSLESA